MTPITVTQSSGKLSILYAPETQASGTAERMVSSILEKRLLLLLQTGTLLQLITHPALLKLKTTTTKVFSKIKEQLVAWPTCCRSSNKLTMTKHCKASTTFFLVINTDRGNGQATYHNWNRKPCRESRPITAFIHAQQYSSCHWLINEHRGLFWVHVFWWSCTGRSQTQGQCVRVSFGYISSTRSVPDPDSHLCQEPAGVRCEHQLMFGWHTAVQTLNQTFIWNYYC